MKLHPLTKLIIVIFITSCSLLYRNPLILFTFLLLSIILAMHGYSNASERKKLFMKLYRLLPLFVSIMLIQMLFDTSRDVIFQYGIVKISGHGLMTSIQVIIRLLIIIFSAGYLVKMGLRDFLMAFRLVRIPESIAVTIALTIGFIPLFSEQIKQSLEQIKLRNIHINKLRIMDRFNLYLSLIMPILGRSVSNAGYQAIALDLRGFRNGRMHTDFRYKRLGLSDWLIYLIMCLFIFSQFV